MNERPGRRLLFGAFGLALLALAGCVDQKQEVALYQKQLDALPGSAAPAPDDSPLSLQQAMRLAEKNDESLGLSGETYVQALIAEQKTFSTLLPSISLGPSYAGGPQNAPFNKNSYSVPLNANYTAFSLQDMSLVSQNAATAEEDRWLLLDEQQTILQDVAAAYYAVLQDERSVAVDQSSLAEQDERVRQAREESKLGNGTLLDIAQSESDASATRVLLIQAEASVTTSRAALGFLLGIPTETRPLTDEFHPSHDIDRTVDQWLADADAHRQDLIAQAAAVDAARQGVRAAIAEYFPTVTLNLAYILRQQSPPFSLPWTSALNLNLPIFTGGSNEADVRNAFSLLRAAILTQSQTRKQVEEDIRNGYANLLSSRDQINELRVELSASRDALIQSQAQYSVGTATNLDVLTAQDSLLSSQLQLATQVYQRKIAFLNLLRVAGHLTFVDAAPTTVPFDEERDLLETTTPDVVHARLQPTSVP
jgi:outer membrane protein TolC